MVGVAPVMGARPQDCWHVGWQTFIDTVGARADGRPRRWTAGAQARGHHDSQDLVGCPSWPKISLDMSLVPESGLTDSHLKGFRGLELQLFAAGLGPSD